MNMLMQLPNISPEFWKGYWRHSVGFDRMVNTLTRIIDDQNAAGTRCKGPGQMLGYRVKSVLICGFS